MGKSYNIAILPGDGTGPEVVVEGLKVLNAAARKFDFKVNTQEFDFGGERYKRTGEVLPDNASDELRKFDSIFLGAVGYPGVPDHVSLWGLLIPIRRTFEQYINLRPVKLFDGIRSPLADVGPQDIDLVVVRENNEGEY